MEWSKEVMARNIRRYMEQAGKNQKELAQIVGVSAPTVNEWLKAKKYPRIDKIEIMANYFGCEKSDLIEDKRETPFVSKEAAERNTKLANLYSIMLRDPTLLDMVDKLAKMDDEQRASYQQIMDLLDKK